MPTTAPDRSARRYAAPAALSLLILVLPLRAAAFAPIALTVREERGVERRHWPLTVSVPFGRGELRPDTSVTVADGSGARVPVQARPLVSWPDGSVRWLLLDTQIDLRAGQEKQLRVEAGRAPTAAATVQVSETDDGVRVNTGAVEFSIPRKRFAIIDAVQAKGSKQALSGALSSTLVAGERTGHAQPPTRITVPEKGPLRARIELRGTYGNSFDYLVRVEAYAGQPFVRVWHTFIDRFQTPYVNIPRLSLELPLAGLAPARYRLGLAGAKPVSGTLDDGVRLLQLDNERYQLDGSAAAGQLAGWIELDGSRGSLGLASRWFWQEYPQSISAHADRLVYNLWAPEAEPAKTGVGAAKTHEFALWIAAPKALPAGAAAALTAPLLAGVDPAHVARSGALPMALPPQAGADSFVAKALAAARRYARRNADEMWNDCGAVHCDKAGRERKRVGAYGMWNWGDWNFRNYQDTTKGTDSWGNLEYDTALVLALTYAATGAPDVHEQMVAAARHFVDVDTIHDFPARPEWVGMNHPKNPLHFSFELGGPDLGHTWTEGSLAYYYLTGDERGLDAARGVADYLAQRVTGFLRGNPRQWGWPQIALLAVYDATGDRRYLTAARAYAEGGMRAHPPTSSAQWKLGILADALAYTHAATGDEAMKAWLQTYAGAVMQRRGREDIRAFPAVAYVAALTGDPALRAAVRERVQRLDLGNWGKPFTINGRIGFRIESLLDDAKR
jgi:hypothetical protein